MNISILNHPTYLGVVMDPFNTPLVLLIASNLGTILAFGLGWLHRWLTRSKDATDWSIFDCLVQAAMLLVVISPGCFLEEVQAWVALPLAVNTMAAILGMKTAGKHLPPA